MFRNRLAAVFVPLFVTGAALASTPVSGQSETAQKADTMSATFSVLHAVSQASIKLSEMAEKRSKSDLVKSYARDMATANADTDAKLKAMAQKHGIEIVPLDPQTEEGKSLLDRMKAEMVMLGSLEGDAFDKSYMTLVTNTQQSVVHLLESRKAMAKDPEVKQFLANVVTAVQNRLKRAQDIMAKVYGDEV
jgi:predicted outer membrane protein